jgi:hypothetical protein
MLRICFLAALAAGVTMAANIAPAFNANYTLVDLGSAPNVAANYGGLNFLAGNLNVLLLGGAANGASGVIDAVGLTRGAGGHITGFDGTKTIFSTAPNIDGGLIYAPNGDVLYTAYPSNQIGQIKPGSTVPDLVVGAPGASSVGTLGLVPAGYNGAGNFIVGSYSGGTFCVSSLTPDGSGTYSIGTCGGSAATANGPEGIVWVPQGSALFPLQSALVSEFSAGRVSAYQIDGNGLPIPGTQQDFIQNLGGAEGAVIDPVTGDFLFSTFGGQNRIIEVQGFAAAATSAPEPATLLVAGLSLVWMARYRRKK